MCWKFPWMLLCLNFTFCICCYWHLHTFAMAWHGNDTECIEKVDKPYQDGSVVQVQNQVGTIQPSLILEHFLYLISFYAPDCCILYLVLVYFSYRTNQTNIFISVICKHNGFCNEKCCLFPFCHLDIKNNYSQPSRLISVAPSVFTTAGLSSTRLHSLNRAADQMAGDQWSPV